MSDLRYALRTFLKNPGFTIVAIATLALGIGANTAIFSIVNAVLLRPLPFADADRLVRAWTTTPEEPFGSYAAKDFLDVQRENQSFQAIAGYRSSLFTAIARNGEPVPIEGAFVTIDFFDVLGVPAALGRTVSRSIDTIGGERAVVLSDKAWRHLYAGATDAVGERLRIDGESHTVLGVMPARAEWPEAADIWVVSQKEVPPSPISEETEAGDREVRYFDGIARLKSGVTFARAQQDMKRLGAVLQTRRSASAEPRDLAITPLREAIVGDVRFALLVLQAAVGVVLLIACANVSGLLIARASGRQRELAVRAALGAGRGRLIGQLLVESLLLGFIGGLCGLLLGAWLVGVLTGILPQGVPRAGGIRLDTTVALVTLVASLATGVLFGVMPALQASRADAGVTLKRSGDRGSPARATARSVLVVAEIALTLVLLAGAGLLLNSFLRLQQVDSGLEPENVTIVGLALPQSRYPTAATQSDVYRRLLQGLAERTEIEAAGVSFPSPLRASNAAGAFFVEGRPTTPADSVFANIGSVSGGYFAATGISLMSGRTFAESDTASAPPVGIVSMALARKTWPGENAVGKRIRFGGDPKEPWRTIVGIVSDSRQAGLDHDAPPLLYIPYEQFPLPFTTVAVRSRAPEVAIAALVRAQLSQIDPELPPGDVSTLQGVLDRSVSQPRFRTLLISAFAGVAMVLAAVGVFGLISYSVAQQTREIGIRIALGASPQQVLRPMVREGLTLAGLGVGIGLVGALLLGRVIGSFLYDVAPRDPLTFTAVATILFGVAFLATYLPARRALHVDPIAALRAE